MLASLDLNVSGTIDIPDEALTSGGLLPALAAAIASALSGSVLGPELVTDGGMDGTGQGSLQDNEWGATYGALVDGALGFSLAQGEVLAEQVIAGRPHPAGTYRLTWDQNLSAGSVTASLDLQSSAPQSGTGPVSVDVVATEPFSVLRFRGFEDAAGTIDNVSLRRVLV